MYSIICLFPAMPVQYDYREGVVKVFNISPEQIIDLQIEKQNNSIKFTVASQEVFEYLTESYCHTVLFPVSGVNVLECFAYPERAEYLFLRMSTRSDNDLPDIVDECVSGLGTVLYKEHLRHGLAINQSIQSDSIGVVLFRNSKSKNETNDSEALVPSPPTNQRSPGNGQEDRTASTASSCVPVTGLSTGATTHNDQAGSSASGSQQPSVQITGITTSVRSQAPIVPSIGGTCTPAVTSAEGLAQPSVRSTGGTKCSPPAVRSPVCFQQPSVPSSVGTKNSTPALATSSAISSQQPLVPSSGGTTNYTQAASSPSPPSSQLSSGKGQEDQTATRAVSSAPANGSSTGGTANNVPAGSSALDLKQPLVPSSGGTTNYTQAASSPSPPNNQRSSENGQEDQTASRAVSSAPANGSSIEGSTNNVPAGSSALDLKQPLDPSSGGTMYYTPAASSAVGLQQPLVPSIGGTMYYTPAVISAVGSQQPLVPSTAGTTYYVPAQSSVVGLQQPLVPCSGGTTYYAPAASSAAGLQQPLALSSGGTTYYAPAGTLTGGLQQALVPSSGTTTYYAPAVSSVVGVQQPLVPGSGGTMYYAPAMSSAGSFQQPLFPNNGNTTYYAPSGTSAVGFQQPFFMSGSHQNVGTSTTQSAYPYLNHAPQVNSFQTKKARPYAWKYRRHRNRYGCGNQSQPQIEEIDAGQEQSPKDDGPAENTTVEEQNPKSSSAYPYLNHAPQVNGFQTNTARPYGWKNRRHRNRYGPGNQSKPQIEEIDAAQEQSPKDDGPAENTTVEDQNPKSSSDDEKQQ